MNKAPRYMKEYADYKRRKLNQLALDSIISSDTWNTKTDKLYNVIALYQKGLITIDEAMSELAKI